MKKILIVCAFCLVTACFGGYSPDSKFYNLQPIADGGAVSDKVLSIGVNEVNLPDYLDKPQIVVFEEGTPQMGISELNRWGEPLDSMVQRIVAADMSVYLPQSEIKARTLLMEHFDYIVDIQIVRFDMVWNDKAVLEAWWYISNAQGKIVYKKKALQSEKIGRGFDDFAKAESRLLGQMSREIALKVAELKK